MNVSDTMYPVVKFVGKKIFKWKLQYEPDQVNWDLFWTDNAVQPETLGKMQRTTLFHYPYQPIKKLTTSPECTRWPEKTTLERI